MKSYSEEQNLTKHCSQENKVLLRVQITRCILYGLQGKGVFEFSITFYVDHWNRELWLHKPEQVNVYEYLGLIVDSQISWKNRISKIEQNVAHFLEKYY